MKGLQYLISLQDRVSAVADRIGGKVRNLVDKMDKLTGVQEKVQNSAGKAARGIDGMGSSMSRFVKIGSLAAGMSIASNLWAMGQQVVGVGKQFVDSALEMQGAERVIKFASGKEGAANLKFLYSTINKLNLPLVETRNAFASVTGAFKDTVLQGQPMRDIFEGVSTSTSAMGLSGDTTQGVFLALSQMMSKGKVSAEELTGQLGERLPGALNIAARAMGMTQAKLLDMMSEGKIMSTDFLPKFATELKKTFGDEAVKAAQLPQAQLTKLSNKFELLKIKLGNELMPVVLKVGIVLMEVFDRAMPVIDAVSNFISERFAKLSQIFAPIIQALPLLVEPFNTLMQVLFSLYSILLNIFDSVFSMVVGAVDWGGLLSSIFTIAGSVIGSIATILRVVWNILEPIVGLIIKLVGWIINGLGGLGLKILEGVAWAFQKIAQGVEWIYNKVVGLLEAVGLLDKKNVVIGVQQKVDKAANPFGSNVGGLNPDAFNKPSATAPAGAKASADKINQGGSRPINISIKYDAMIAGGVTIQSTVIKEGAAELQRMLEELLLRTLNGATQLAVK